MSAYPFTKEEFNKTAVVKDGVIEIVVGKATRRYTGEFLTKWNGSEVRIEGSREVFRGQLRLGIATQA